MYRCGFCGGVSSPNEKQARVVTETRQRTYESRDKYGEVTQSIGFEIVRETKGHASCADKAMDSDVTKAVKERVTESRKAGNALRIRRFIAARAAEETEEDND